MKHLLLMMLIALMSTNVKETTMAINQTTFNDGVGGAVRRPAPAPTRTLRRPSGTQGLSTPAWLGSGGAQGGFGQNYTPAVPGWQEPLSNTGSNAGGSPDERDERNQRMNMNNMLPGGTGASTPPPQAPPIAWLQPRAGGAFNYANRPMFQNNPILPNIPRPANFGNIQNPNQMGTTEQGTPTMGVNSFIGGGGESVIHPGGGAVNPWGPAGVNTFIGGGGLAMRGPNGTIWPEPEPVAPPTGGFGTYYGGNWRGGGGGGGWGGGGSEYPAWLNMGLNSWNFKG